MSVSPASVSSDTARTRVLVCGLNWLGDAVMSMPGLEALKREQPDVRITMLVKRKLAGLWALHADVEQVEVLPEQPLAMLGAARALGKRRFERAYVLPHSFRAALVPFVARVPNRIGPPGHCRDWMLSQVERPAGAGHQAREYFTVFSVPVPEGGFARPRLKLGPDLLERARTLAGCADGGAGRRPLVVLMPGAARGPAKRWPPECFAQVGRVLRDRQQCRLLVLGAPNETALCAEVVARIGREARNLAGRTSLPELAAVLSLCTLSVTNDSGGMHLAAAIGSRIVAVFGMTDPDKTGPLWGQPRILRGQQSGRRDVPRDSVAARQSLRTITPDDVLDAALAMLRE